MIGRPDPGRKPAVPNRRSDGNGGANMADNDNDYDRGSGADEPVSRVSLESARGGQSSPRPVFKATETPNKPVTSGGQRAIEGTTRSKDAAPGMGGAPIPQ